MNTRNTMVIAKGKIITSDIKYCNYNSSTGKYDIVFKTEKTFSYNFDNILILTNPEVLNASLYKIEHLGKEFFDIESIFVFENAGDRYWHICFENGSERDYNEQDLMITKSCLAEDKTKDVFDYLKQTAHSVSVRSEDGTHLLSVQYDKIGGFVSDDSAMTLYLNPEKYKNINFEIITPIFPFGCNQSQYIAVKNALENKISIIQGPPGTGKTQTILNIVSNLLLNGKTVQIVSNNNSAVANVAEKLSDPKYNLGFISAFLGSSKNKEDFIKNQSGVYPDISSWHDNVNILRFRQEIESLSESLGDVFKKQERLAVSKHQLQALQKEKKYFEIYKNESATDLYKLKIKKDLTSENILKLWNEIQLINENGKKLSFLFKLRSLVLYGVSNFKVYRNDISKVITELQDAYYTAKEIELLNEISEIENYLQSKNAVQLADDLQAKSLKLLRYMLYLKYGARAKRTVFTMEDLWKKYYEFICEYPIVLSTTYSSRSSVCKSAKFDYVIIDEASQVDVATGALALSCAKNVVIVGDSKQLANVVTDDTAKITDAIFEDYQIDDAYRFSQNSFLSSICALLPDVPQSLLREHYRCHPQIIGFCNQKFYGGQLIPMTEYNGENNALAVFKTVKGNHCRDYFNQRQIDVIIKEVMPDVAELNDNIGIIAPYNNQVNALERVINNSQIDIATVHKFQGREKDCIILTTVDDEISEFVDNSNFLNVAVSRAKSKLVLVVTGNEIPKGSNIDDLITYIEYNNFSVTESKIYSVFDLMYKDFTQVRFEYLKGSKRISEYDSENLMFKLICDVLKNDEFLQYDVISHQPLNMLIKNPEYLDDELCRYAMNKGTHLDFLIFNRIGKKPVLAIEVDGYNYHKAGTTQSKRDRKKDRILELYNIPLLRFSTIGNTEKEKLIAKLRSLQ